MSSVHQSEATTSNAAALHPPAPQSSKYRAYVSAVDKALKSFEATTEWADLIAALGKLGKVFHSHSKLFNDVPNPVTVAKRLSQCLHPALPSGVHLKALETYKQVFAILGRSQNLPKYLYLFAVGLFPLMDHCGIKVKNELLTIFETYLLPLGADLRPSLPGFIAAVLLGLEEGTEFYSRSFSLLEQVLDNVGAETFYACLWQAALGSPSVRLPALIFVNSKWDKSIPLKDQFYMMSGGVCTDHMTLALCAIAEDPGTSLTQRNLLDFLCVALPLNSDHVMQADLVQILRRCLFVVLRRDMSLNRRLYQWLLNRSNDVAFSSLPVGGTEDAQDLDFFRQFSLPLIKMALLEFLQLDTVEIPTTNPLIGATGGTWDSHKETKVHFTEVRVCKLLHYFLDRPELGDLVLRETLSMFLEFACRQDRTIIQELREHCEEIDPSFAADPAWEPFLGESTPSPIEQTRRLDDIRKNFNSLLNSLDAGLLWQYLEDFFKELHSTTLEPITDDDRLKLTNEERQARELREQKLREHIQLFPLMVMFCVKTVQLDSHGDIRGRHLARLLETILKTIREKGCDTFSVDNLVSLFVVARRLIVEINQSVSAVESGVDLGEATATDRSGSNESQTLSREERLRRQFREDFLEEQRMIERCLTACCDLLADVCAWYASDRDRNKTGVLCGMSALLRDFADFPLYCFKFAQDNSISDLSASTSNSSLSWPNVADSGTYPTWLAGLLSVIDGASWLDLAKVRDFDVRTRMLDLMLYLYVRSASVQEQHKALVGRQYQSSYDSAEAKQTKTTTTILLKPFLSDGDLTRIENDGVFKESARVLWSSLGEDVEAFNEQTVVCLLCRLHSRRVGETSSDVEEIIVGDLTAPSKVTCCRAAKKFRDLWALTRNVQDGAYAGVPQKPMNRVVMVLLGVLADESAAMERTELRAIAYAWFIDCARHNDLHRILQILFLMLLNPATARVAIQFVQVQSRITRDQVPQMPPEANAISLATIRAGKQTFHHVCRDIDTPLPRDAPKSSTAPWNDFTFIDCSRDEQWILELKKRFLLPMTPEREVIQSVPREENNVKFRPTHKRNMSDIPQFDEEDEVSEESISIDGCDDADVADALQYIVDCVVEEEECDLEEGEERFENAPSDFYCALKKNSTATLGSATTLPLPSSKDEPSPPQQMRERLESSPARYESEPTSVGKNTSLPNGVNGVPEDTVSVVASTYSTSSLPPTAIAISPTRPDTIKRVKCGHRRQDSLQESIFNSTTKELRLFDPAEIPQLTHPGDAKQPLLDESHAHMLFYAESPRVVDLGRAEKIFRMMTSILRNGAASSLGRLIVNSMIFTNTAHLQQMETLSGSGAFHQLVEYLIRHYKHMQGEGFWCTELDPKATGSVASGSATMIPGSDKNRSPTFFEIFATVLLYYLRSYYLNSPTTSVSVSDLNLAWKCKIAALECFTELLRTVNELVKEVRSRDFVAYIQQLYRFTRAQRVIISLMLTAVPAPPSQRGWRIPVTMDIAEFNNGPPDDPQFRDLLFAYHRSLLHLASTLVVLEYNMYTGIGSYNSVNLGINFEPLYENRMTYNSPQNRLNLRDPRYLVVELKLFIIVILNALKRCPERHELWLHFLVDSMPFLDRTLPTFAVHVVEQLCRNIYACVAANYNNSVAMLAGLELPLASPTEPRSSPQFFADFRLNKRDSYAPMVEHYPANYTITLLESLTSIVHYCMIDSSSASLSFRTMRGGSNAGSLSSSLKSSQLSMHNGFSTPAAPPHATPTHNMASNMTSMVGSAISIIPGTKAASELVGNLFGRVFTTGDTTASQPNASKYASTVSEDWLIARKELVKIFPSSLAVICDVWAFALKDQQPRSAIGSTQQIRTLVLDLLGPIAKTQPNVLIHGFAMVWLTRTSSSSNSESDQPCFVYSDQQMGIAQLVLSLKASLPVNALISTVVETLKDCASKSIKSSPGSDRQAVFPVEIALLELLHGCIRLLPAQELRDCWAGLNILFTESPLALLSPRATFLEFVILVDFVRLYGSQAIIDDKSVSRSVQDACQRLTEAVNTIVGWQLESTTWLKRTLVVRQDNSNAKGADTSPTMDQRTSVSSLAASEVNSMRGSTFSLTAPSNRMSQGDAASQYTGSLAQLSQADSKKSSSTLRSSVKDTNNNRRDPANSTKALFLLADNLAELIDSVCKSEDKERLLPTLQAVWGNTLPYLRAKSARNVRFFLASSQFLASMSTFNYMRPVWKKTSMELLFDSAFFKMDIHALKQWLIVIDNLMTNDKTSFKELLARIPTGPTTTLSNLITSKDQEYEMRAQALKRLAFVVLSSQLDQYSTYLPDIQERLSDNLRLSQVPVVHAQVFVCYRVLLIRMKPAHFVSIWPSMVTELVQVLLQIEQQLSDKGATVASDDLKCSRDEQWMQLYLSACKLLDTLCTLPSGYVAQFQMCHWAFVSCLPTDTVRDVFIPFATRITTLLNAKYGELSSSDREIVSASLGNVKTLTSFQELQPFFLALATQHKSRTVDTREEQLRDAGSINGSMSLKAAIARLEHSLYVDFADHWQL